MSKNHKILIVLGTALLMAFLAGLGIVSFLSPRRSTIYVFRAAYPIGTQLVNEMLVPIQVDAKITSAGRHAKVDEQLITSKNIREVLESGDSLKVSVGEGMPLMPSMLSVAGGNSIMMTMAPSSVAVTVSVDDITGVTKELYSGASVNVFVTSYTGGTFLLFENMRILDINRKTNAGDLASATLEVTNEQAVKLINSARNGAIHFGLINPTGYKYEDGTSDILVDNSQKTDKEFVDGQNGTIEKPTEKEGPATENSNPNIGTVVEESGGDPDTINWGQLTVPGVTDPNQDAVPAPSGN